MSNLTNFKNFITESSDRAELKAMGFKSDLSFDDRLTKAIDDWYKDPEINDAIMFLRSRAEELMLNNDINIESDPEDELEWQKRIDLIYANNIDEMGWFDFATIM